MVWVQMHMRRIGYRGVVKRDNYGQPTEEVL